jgi:hypothetical protein
VAFEYEAPPRSPALRQAEVLANLNEYRAVRLDANGSLEYLVIGHPMVVVMSQDCDLEQDCALRFPSDGAVPSAEQIEMNANSLAQVILCDAYTETEIRAKLASFGSKDWKHVDQNQNERYHRFAAASVGTDSQDVLDAMYIDFRKHFTVPTGFLHGRIAAAETVRRAVLPPVYSHDLIHRFYNYQSRIAIP